MSDVRVETPRPNHQEAEEEFGVEYKPMNTTRGAARTRDRRRKKGIRRWRNLRRRESEECWRGLLERESSLLSWEYEDDVLIEAGDRDREVDLAAALSELFFLDLTMSGQGRVESGNIRCEEMQRG